MSSINERSTKSYYCRKCNKLVIKEDTLTWSASGRKCQRCYKINELRHMDKNDMDNDEYIQYVQMMNMLRQAGLV